MKYSFLLLLFSTLFFSYCKKDNLTNDDLNFIGTGNGCSNFFVYKLNENKKIGLVIYGQRDSLGLNDQIQSYELDIEDNITVKIHELQNGGSYYCDDVIESNEELLNSFDAESGMVKIQITEDSINYNVNALNFEIYYKINVSLENVHFLDSSGNELMIEEESFTDVLVGWLPG